ncbi:hypothetical protein J6590_093950 [Homalodisca vitripennis]|nr:hypothetical protein J6590_093950 [Homalodisca vitripennis]
MGSARFTVNDLQLQLASLFGKVHRERVLIHNSPNKTALCASQIADSVQSNGKEEFASQTPLGTDSLINSA